MKIRAYIRVAKNGFSKYRIDAGAKENNIPLSVMQSYNEKKFLPTVAFAVDLVIDDALFNNASRVIGQIDVSMKDAIVLGELLVPAINKAIKEVKNKKRK